MRRAHRIRRLWLLGLFGLLLPAACALGSRGLYRQSVVKSKEAVLREELWILRDSIQEFHERHQTYPRKLQDLVAEGYVHWVPVDPMTNSADTWIMKDASDGQGIADVRSGAEGKTNEGILYSDF